MPSTRRSAVTTQPQDGQSSPPASDASTSEQQEDTTEEAGPLQEAKTAPTALNEQKTTPTVPLLETTKSSTSNEVQVMQVDSVPPAAKVTPQPPPQEILMEEPVRVTRLRSRRTRVPPSDR